MATNLLGIDVGFSTTRPTTGIAFLNGGHLYVKKARTDALSREKCIPAGFQAQVIAIDGPLLPRGAEEKIRRKCESIFIRSPFWNRCKPGLSHQDFGLRLRRATRVACRQFMLYLDPALRSEHDEFARKDARIVEAFPNAFLGVLLSEDRFDGIRLRRGKRFDWLYDQVFKGETTIRKLRERLDLPEEFWNTLKTEEDHEKRAALICLLTAAFVSTGKAERVGDDKSGWFWLPHESLWQPWATEGLKSAIEKCREF